MIPKILELLTSLISIKEHAQHVTCRRVNKMVWATQYRHRQIEVADNVVIRTDASRWLSSAGATRVTRFLYEEIHNRYLRTSGINWSCFINSILELDTAHPATNPPNDRIGPTANDLQVQEMHSNTDDDCNTET